MASDFRHLNHLIFLHPVVGEFLDTGARCFGAPKKSSTACLLSAQFPHLILGPTSLIRILSLMADPSACPTRGLKLNWIWLFELFSLVFLLLFLVNLAVLCWNIGHFRNISANLPHFRASLWILRLTFDSKLLSANAFPLLISLVFTFGMFMTELIILFLQFSTIFSPDINQQFCFALWDHLTGVCFNK